MGRFGRLGFGRLAGMAMAAAIVLGAGAAHAVPCAQPNEHAALGTRVLQSNLMVAALSCGDRANYNTFVRKYERELVTRGRSMQAFFTRAYGGGGTSQMNRFVTSLANDASARSRTAPNFCNEIHSLFDTLLQGDPSRLNDVLASQTFTGSHGFASCQKPSDVTTASAKPKATTAAKSTPKSTKVAKAKDSKATKSTGKDAKSTGKDAKPAAAKAAQADPQAAAKTAKN